MERRNVSPCQLAKWRWRPFGVPKPPPHLTYFLPKSWRTLVPPLFPTDAVYHGAVFTWSRKAERDKATERGRQDQSSSDEADGRAMTEEVNSSALRSFTRPSLESQAGWHSVRANCYGESPSPHPVGLGLTSPADHVTIKSSQVQSLRHLIRQPRKEA